MMLKTDTLHGIPAAPGIAIGTAVVVLGSDLDVVPDKIIEDVDKEIEILKKAFKKTRSEVEKLRARLVQKLLSEEQNLFDAYLRILESQSIKQAIVSLIQERHWAPWALRTVIKQQVHKFETIEDPYLRERSADILDLGRKVLANLQSENPQIPLYPKDTILIGEEVPASVLAEVPSEQLLGIASIKGSANAHMTILAKAMGIPVVTGVKGLTLHQLEGKKIIVDGYHGDIFTSPSASMVTCFSRLMAEEKELYVGLEALKELHSETPDGIRISLYANAGFVSDLRPAMQAGAEGIGLYRTEVPFMIRDRFPSEEEQYVIYRQLLASFSPKPVIIRTLDVGGDKFLPYFLIQEDNPFLGWRGIRITLDHPEIFLGQLRAMLRASSGFKNLSILFPMISNLTEVDEALCLLRQAYREVIDEGADILFPQTGVMIEVPSAAYQAQEIAKKVDFLSVGSNDLTQYILAVDRNNIHVAGIYESLHPAVIATLKWVVEAAHAQNKPVSICGEMASDPIVAILLLGLGFDTLSMNASSIPRIKWIIRNFPAEKAKNRVAEILNLHHAKDIRSHLEKALEEAGLGEVVRTGKQIVC